MFATKDEPQADGPQEARRLRQIGRAAPRPPFAVIVQTAQPQSYDSDITLTGTVKRPGAERAVLPHQRPGDRAQSRRRPACRRRTTFWRGSTRPNRRPICGAAQAGLAGAEATMRQADAAFERQKSLLASGYATQAAYDLAERAQRTAAGSLDVAKAQVATAQDALSYTYLRAGHPGMITARNIEVGQVAQAAQMAFVLAQDGPRDAVFAVFESAFSHKLSKPQIDLSPGRRPVRQDARQGARSLARRGRQDRHGSGQGRNRSERPGPAARRRRDRHGTRAHRQCFRAALDGHDRQGRQAGDLGGRSRRQVRPSADRSPSPATKRSGSSSTAG